MVVVVEEERVLAAQSHGRRAPLSTVCLLTAYWRGIAGEPWGRRACAGRACCVAEGCRLAWAELGTSTRRFLLAFFFLWCIVATFC